MQLQIDGQTVAGKPVIWEGSAPHDVTATVKLQWTDYQWASYDGL